MARDPYRYFRVESREILDQLSRGALDLERGAPSPAAVAHMLRLAHTLKGAARVVRQTEIADLAHAMEDALAPLREGAAAPRERVDVLLRLLDAAGARVAALESSMGAGPGPAATPAEEPVRTLRADVSEVDALLDGIGQAHAQLAAVRRGLRPLERARRLADLLAGERATPRPRGGPPDDGGGAAPKAGHLAEELRGLLAVLQRRLGEGVERVDREIRQAREAAERLRLLPADLLFNPLERAVRDAARSVGRRAAFEGRGGDVRLAADVLAVVQNALLQLARNAVAHGIEPEAERRAAGKPPEGRVTLEVRRRGGRVSFLCRDDGRGIDVEAVRIVAQRRGLLSPEARGLGPEEILRVLLEGGITTTSAVSETAGRGIGLDIVREAAARLGGEIVVRTEAGRGVAAELTVPVSLSSVDALLVEAGGRAAALPFDGVRHATRVRHEDLARTAEGASILYEGRAVPFAPLARWLGGDAGRDVKGACSAVVLRSDGGLAAVGVDRLLGRRSVVLRPLPAAVQGHPVVAGAWLDPEGEPQLVFDLQGLVAAARSAEAPRAAPPAPPPLLVIDDSLTTRMLERSILESAGYEVDLAASAEEALEMARRRRYGLFIVDVEMPGMDGFAFMERAREDPRLRDVPSIVVTSRSAPEDRRRGGEAGARAYVVKSEFDQGALLETIRSLVV